MISWMGEYNNFKQMDLWITEITQTDLPEMTILSM